MTASGDQQPSAEEQARICEVIEKTLPHSGVSVLYQDIDLKYVWSRNLHPAFSTGSITGLRDSDILPEPEAELLSSQKQAVLSAGAPRSIELRLDYEKRLHWFLIMFDLDRDDDGNPAGVVTTMIDSTDQKRREHTLSTLLRELSHRSKNLLAIILAIAAQTGRYSPTVEMFLARFRGRIQSLSFSQDLVTASNWSGASLHDLVMHQLSRFCANPALNIRFEGLNVNLDPNSTLHIGLGLHELAVNSATFGAFSSPDGAVLIHSSLDGDGSLLIHWIEALHPTTPAAAPGEKRFGSVTLERVVPAAVNGKARLTIDDRQIDYQLTVPRDQFETI